jgi:hypothetical protein
VIIPLPEPQEAGVVVTLSWKAARGTAWVCPSPKTREGQEHNDVNNIMSRTDTLDGISGGYSKTGPISRAGLKFHKALIQSYFYKLPPFFSNSLIFKKSIFDL